VAGDLLDWEGCEWCDLTRNEKKACMVLGWDADFFEDEFEEDDLYQGSKSGRKATKYKDHKTAYRKPVKRYGGYKSSRGGDPYAKYRR